MSTDPVSAKSSFLCTYMSHHPDTLVSYVRHWGAVRERVDGAKMTAIDSKGMSLTYTTRGSKTPKDIRVPFDPPLSGYDDVKPRLLQMKLDAEDALGMTKRPQIPSYVWSNSYLSSGIFLLPILPLTLLPGPTSPLAVLFSSLSSLLSSSLSLFSLALDSFAPSLTSIAPSLEFVGEWLAALLADAASRLSSPELALPAIEWARETIMGPRGVAYFWAVWFGVHALESVYTVWLCVRHRTPVGSTILYVLTNMMFGFPVFAHYRKMVQEKRIESIMKGE
ncbi:hypothetical protein BDW22DRAFT_1362464 [Trametopsis cervina]|nr:hypothetical protein BDW22DRAFT_1362464 [Trametopsis cervina]